MAIIHLADRGIVSVSGPDAEQFLQNLVTTDINSIGENETWPGALLTPQGKIMLAFLIARTNDGFLLEIHEDDTATLVQRLMLYKLRAKVEIAALETRGISVFFDEAAPVEAVLDHRFDIAGIKLYRLVGQHERAVSNVEAYTTQRILAGVAEIHSDYPPQDAFPHDVLFDMNGGVSFRKGCYVGQEVVSRMQHRGTARRRLVLVSAESELPAPGETITAAGKPSGTLGSVSGRKALAIVRTDRIATALQKKDAILALNQPINITAYTWSNVSLSTESRED